MWFLELSLESEWRRKLANATIVTKTLIHYRVCVCVSECVSISQHCIIRGSSANIWITNSRDCFNVGRTKCVADRLNIWQSHKHQTAAQEISVGQTSEFLENCLSDLVWTWSVYCWMTCSWMMKLFGWCITDEFLKSLKIRVFCLQQRTEVYSLNPDSTGLYLTVSGLL